MGTRIKYYFLLITTILVFISMPVFGEICKQEYHNVTASCGDVVTYDNGSISDYAAFSPSWTDYKNIYDGDYSTFAYRNDNNDGSFRINYSVPNITGVQVVNDAIWSVKYVNGTPPWGNGLNISTNFSMKEYGCFDNGNPGQIKIAISSLNGISEDRLRFRCWTGDQWIGSNRIQLLYTPYSNITQNRYAYLFEEAIYWNITLSEPNITHYNITSCDQLFNVNDSNGYYHVKNNLDCSTYNTTGLNKVISGTFSGTLDGENHTIANIDLRIDLTQNTGLIEILEGTVKNLILDNISVGGSEGEGGIGSQNCGILASRSIAGASVSQVGIRNSLIKCAYAVGGFIGDVNGGTTIQNSYIDTTEVKKLKDTADNHHGGIGGYSTSDLTTNYIYSSITATSEVATSNLYAIAGEISSYTNTIWDNSSAPNGDSGTTEASYFDMRQPDTGLWDNFSTNIWNVTEGEFPFFVWEDRTIENPGPVIIVQNVTADTDYYDLTELNDSIEYRIRPWVFGINITDNEPITQKSIIFRNTSGILGTFNQTDNITLSGLKFLYLGNFTIEINATDYYGNTTYLNYSFQVNDSINPECLGFDDINAINNTNVTYSFFCADETLYTTNYSCTNGINDEHIGLIRTYNFTQSKNTANNVVCTYEVCDGHTKKTIDDMRPKKDKKDTITFEDRIDISSQDETDDITYTKHKDKYSFKFKYKTKKNQVSIDVPQDCYYSGSGKYKGWFLCPDTQTWIDFEGDHDVTVNGHTVIVKSRKAGGQKEFQFNSIGKFNCISGSQTITVTEPVIKPSLSFFRSFETIEEALTIMFFWGFWLLLAVLTLILKGKNDATIQLLNLFQVFFGIVAGVMTFPVSPALALLISFVAVGLFWGKIYDS